MTRRRLFAARTVQPVLAAFECKIKSIFSKSNEFMQKAAKSLHFSYYENDVNLR
jgi:hypothetical protein